jgi:transmembrane sensor
MNTKRLWQVVHRDPMDDMDGGNSIEDQALQWVMRLTSGEIEPGMLEEYEQWRRADRVHEAAIVSARRLWLKMGTPLETRYDPVVVNQTRMRARSRSMRWRRSLQMATAALLVLAMGMGWQWQRNWRYDQVTGTGEQRTVALADGSTLWLNTDSAVDVEVDTHRRHVRLMRGEAFFDVRRDPARPFTIDAGLGQVRVLGTAFAVRRDGDDVVVTVQRGRVRVSGGGTAPVEIVPNQRVRVHASDAMKRVELADAEDELAWRNGQLVFVDRPLSEILAEVGRYDSRMLLVRYPQANRVRMSAVIDLARLDEWYGGLQQSLPVKVTEIGPVVWIASVKRPAK